MVRKTNHLKTPLPVRDGVSASRVWLPEGNWLLMIDFLVEKFPNISKNDMIGRMERGELVDSKGERYYPDSPYRSNLHIFYYRELIQETEIPFTASVLYRDDHILVADKPHFLPVVPAGRFLHQTLLVRLKNEFQLDELTPIHRIDRETAGVVMFCINPNSRGKYQSLFQQRKIEKSYQAVVRMQPSQRQLFPLVHRSKMIKGTPFFRMQEVAGEPNSETAIDIIDNNENQALCDLKPVSGKQHQLRVHLASLSCPILNDPFYPELLPCKGDDFSQPLQLLAKSISFDDPITGNRHFFESSRSLNW
ncbi:MAG TPA: pseudouridine synthase [Leucothrix mucor]|nr:pseudouridine synthase [Leucothrix mucor]